VIRSAFRNVTAVGEGGALPFECGCVEVQDCRFSEVTASNACGLAIDSDSSQGSYEMTRSCLVDFTTQGGQHRGLLHFKQDVGFRLSALNFTDCHLPLDTGRGLLWLTRH
jgi:hypothetical protein